MVDEITISPFEAQDPDLNLMGILYCTTFLGADFSAEDLEEAIKNIEKHASYTGFKGFKAKRRDELAGFAYGYTNLPGQFYRERIAEQLTEKEKSVWLSDCFEFVELAVNPLYKRMGLGNRLHDDLMNSIGHKTAVLTTGMGNSQAITLYRNKGWQVIKRDAAVITSGNPQLIMGKKIKEE